MPSGKIVVSSANCIIFTSSLPNFIPLTSLFWSIIAVRKKEQMMKR